MTKIFFFKNPNVRKWISDVIKIGFSMFGGCFIFGSIYILIGLENLLDKKIKIYPLIILDNVSLVFLL